MESDELQIARLLLMRINDHAMYGELKAICNDLIHELEKKETTREPKSE